MLINHNLKPDFSVEKDGDIGISPENLIKLFDDLIAPIEQTVKYLRTTRQFLLDLTIRLREKDGRHT